MRDPEAVTEAEWLGSADTKRMLYRLTRRAANPRRLRLFACALGRRLWHRLEDEASRRAVEVGERFADGRATAAELLAASTAACRAAPRARGTRAAYAAANAADASAVQAAHAASCQAAMGGFYYARQAMLVRCVFGNPFRPAPAVAPAWLAWNEGTVRKLAQAIYDERAFDRLPVLADALEDAGCTDAAVLDHCRCGGEHVRGCWAVDRLLGKG
jgi:hypothetical protein